MCSVDINGKENYKNIKEVPLNAYDTVFICTPDPKKVRSARMSKNKNVLVEKPLLSKK